jgi:hypothetical protein
LQFTKVTESLPAKFLKFAGPIIRLVYQNHAFVFLKKQRAFIKITGLSVVANLLYLTKLPHFLTKHLSFLTKAGFY